MKNGKLRSYFSQVEFGDPRTDFGTGYCHRRAGNRCKHCLGHNLAKLSQYQVQLQKTLPLHCNSSRLYTPIGGVAVTTPPPLEKCRRRLRRHASIKRDESQSVTATPSLPFYHRMTNSMLNNRVVNTEHVCIVIFQNSEKWIFISYQPAFASIRFTGGHSVIKQGILQLLSKSNAMLSSSKLSLWGVYNFIVFDWISYTVRTVRHILKWWNTIFLNE